MKALLLAAGYGSRLRPLTDRLPKPLTLFMGRPILDIVAGQVQRAGVNEIAVNTHHLADQIARHVASSQAYKQPIHISYEPEILGTGGCLNPLRTWLGSDDLLIFNGDIICPLPLKDLMRAFHKSSALAAMALIPHRDGTTPVYVKDGAVVSIGEAVKGAEQRTFSGIHILSRSFVEEVPRQGFLSVIDTYKELLGQKGQILAYDFNGYWADLGIPKDYLEAHDAIWKHPGRDGILEALGFDASGWTFDAAQRTLFVDGAVRAGFKDSFVFGPIPEAEGIHVERCIVYPETDMTSLGDEYGKILSPYARLSIV